MAMKYSNWKYPRCPDCNCPDFETTSHAFFVGHELRQAATCHRCKTEFMRVTIPMGKSRPNMAPEFCDAYFWAVLNCAGDAMELSDSEVRGLKCAISRVGFISFSLMSRVRGEARRRFPFGRFPDTCVSKARSLAISIKNGSMEYSLPPRPSLRWPRIRAWSGEQIRNLVVVDDSYQIVVTLVNASDHGYYATYRLYNGSGCRSISKRLWTIDRDTATADAAEWQELLRSGASVAGFFRKVMRRRDEFRLLSLSHSLSNQIRGIV